MPAADKYTAEKILWIRCWAPNLFSFKLTRDKGFRFTPGQFARLGVSQSAKAPDLDNPKDPSGERIVWRAYSIASAAEADHLEFFSVVIPDGEFTSVLARLRVGDTVYVEKMNYGFFTTDRFKDGRDLWMLATGTGLAPFLSILSDRNNWQQYENFIVVHSVRYPNELAYADTIRAFRMHEYFDAMAHELHYVPVTTRVRVDAVLDARIPALIESGALERNVEKTIDHHRARIMICGNPEMVDATRKLLGRRGFTTSRRANPGHMAVENYW